MASQMIGKILGIVASLIVVKIITGFGTEFYGNYLTTYEFLAFFGIIADAGLFNIAVRDMSRKKELTEKILANTFSMRLILIVFVTILAGGIAQFVPSYSAEVKTGIWITGISMSLTIVAGTLSSVLQARMKIQFFAMGMMLSKIILALLIFGIAQYKNFFENPFFAMLYAGMIANTVFCLLVIYFTSKEVKIRLGFDFNEWKKTLKESLPYGIALIFQTLYLRANTVIISIILGTTAVGIYGVATRVTESLIVLGTFFGQAILPKLSQEEDHPEKFQKTIVWGMEILFMCALPIIIGISKFASEVVSILSSKEFISTNTFLGSDKILALIIITILFAYQNQLFSFALVAQKKQKYLLYVNAIAFFSNILLNIFLLPKFGLIASVYTTIICEFFVFGMLIHATTKKQKLPISWKNAGIIILANSILFLKIHYTPLSNNFLLAGIIGSISYISILFIFRKRLFMHTETQTQKV